MPTYNSTKISEGHPARSGMGVITDYASVSISAAAANGDLAKFFKLPKGAVVLGATLSSTDIDTGESANVTLDVGDADDPNRLIDAATVGQAGGLTTALATTGFGYQYTADTEIYATINTPATGATGTLKLSVTYMVGLVS